MNKASDQVEAIAKKMLEIEQKENAKANDDNTSMDESKLESAENSKKRKKEKEDCTNKSDGKASTRNYGAIFHPVVGLTRSLWDRREHSDEQ